MLSKNRKCCHDLKIAYGVKDAYEVDYGNDTLHYGKVNLMLVTPKCALWQNILQLILHGQIALMIVHAYVSARSGRWGG